MVIKQSNPAVQPEITMRIVTDPVEIATNRARWEKSERNSAWFEKRSGDIFDQNPGKYICVAGEELFVADSALEAKALGRAAHPDDDGSFVLRIPRERTIRV